MSLLYFRISRTMSKKALSTLMRDLADVSMNLHPNERASALPSVMGLATIDVCADLKPFFARGKHVAIVEGFKIVRELTLCAHLSLALQIALVANNDDGEVVLVLDSQYLLLECDDLLIALSRSYAVDEQETLSSPHVLLAHRRIFLLAGCIEHVEQRNLFVDDALLPVRVYSIGRQSVLRS